MMPTLSNLLALLAGLLLAACVSPEAAREAGLGPQAREDETLALEEEVRRSVPLELMPAFEAVVQALEDGDELVARGALSRVFASRPEGRALELALAFERILDGRALTKSLHLRLETEELGSSPLEFRVYLHASHEGTEALRLRASGARVHELLVVVDPDGREARSSHRVGVDFPSELLLPAGEELRFELAVLQLPTPPGLLALSAQLRLEVLPGELLTEEGRSLPAQEVRVEELELVRLASFLPSTTVEPEQVVSYVSRGKIYVPALMERVVRVAPARRGETLDALTPLVESMSLVELELLVPGLRWLARTTGPGGSPVAWRSWLRQRARRSVSEPDWDSIDLPGE